MGNLVESDSKAVVEVVTSFEAAAVADRNYWHSQTPEACLQHALELRRINYGTDRASGRLQRVLEITRRERS